MEDEEILEGTVEDVQFSNPVNGYTVLSLAVNDELVTAVGIMPGVATGESVSLTGCFTVHPTFGRQLKVTSFSRALPETTEQIYKYLASGVVRGVGPKKAMSIVERFGEDTLSIFENEPERLSAIKGISKEQAELLGVEFRKQFSLRTVIMGLEKYGLTPAECVRVFQKLGADAVAKVCENPYSLCSLNIGIPFEKAEDIESRLEKKPKPDFRIHEGILHIMRHNCYSKGHTCIPREKLIRPASELLNISTDDADIAIDSVVNSASLKTKEINNETFLFLPAMYRAEEHIAERMAVITKFPPARTPALSQSIERLEKEDGIIYEEKQREAIATAVNKGLLILTGGPGTGKTTAIKGIIRLFSDKNLEIALAAPTGRAAKRMSEVTGSEAKTIHRLLEVEWDEDDRPVFQRNIENPLDCEVLILDELSMVDVSLFSSLLDALPLGCRLILVGDSDQLPAVGAGNVLHDLINSGLLPVVELTEVFRQALESKIITNAHKIVSGENPDLSNGGDFFHMERRAPSLTADTVVSLCAQRLPAAYKWSAFSDIQVICPSKKGESGTVQLNRRLQAALNPQTESTREIVLMGQTFRTGDKIMQTRNNYNVEWENTHDGEKGSGIFNGDIGILKDIDLKSGLVTVDFDGRTAAIAAENLSDIDLAYAITVHKSQGSEFTAVVLPVCSVVPNLCYRNLLYTAVTRAKTMLITVGRSEDICAMAENYRKTKRYTALTEFLREACG